MDVVSVFNYNYSIDLSYVWREGFPLLTTKRNSIGRTLLSRISGSYLVTRMSSSYTNTESDSGING